MKVAWLEKFAEEGLIRKEVLADIYKDVGALVKEAELHEVKVNVPTATMAQTLRGILLMAGLGGAGMIAKKNYEQHTNESAGRKRVAEARANLVRQAEFHGKEEDAVKRFDEIATYAPHVAMNFPLVRKLVQSRLDKGLSNEDVMQLALLQAQHLPDVMRQDKYLPKQASMRPEKYGEITADVFLMAKTASIGDGAKNFFTNLGLLSGASLAVAAMTGLTNTALAKLDQHKLKKKLEESFNKALAIETKDSAHLRENRDKAQQAFAALSHFAPHVALEPQAAHAFMAKLVSYNQGMHVDEVKALSEIQRNLGDRPSPMSEGFMGAHKVFNMEKLLGDALSRSTVSTLSEKSRANLNNKDLGFPHA